MRIVSAGVHDADVLAVVLRADRGPEGDVDLLGDGERVHIGTKGDDGARSAAPEYANDAGAADAGADLDAQLSQMVRDECRRTRLLSRQLRVRVDIAPPRDNGIVHRVCTSLDVARERGGPLRGRGHREGKGENEAVAHG